MNLEHKQKIKTTILETIEKLEKEIPQLQKQMASIVPDNAIGRLSRMEAVGSKSIQEAALHQAKTRLAGLKTALSKIDQEDFGLCQVCEEEIPLKRLLVMPEKNICVECAP